MMNRNMLKWISYGAAGALAITLSIPVFDFLVTRGDNEYVSYDSKHPEILNARIAARKSIGHFRDTLAASESGDGFNVYVNLFTTRGTVEVVMLDQVEFVGANQVSGRINHPPLNTLREGLVEGSLVTASLNDIADWSYWDGDKLRGDFSARVFLKLQNDETRKAIEATLHESPIP